MSADIVRQHASKEILSSGDSIVDRYTVMGCLGFGDCAAVYYCLDTAREDASVAIKILIPTILADAASLQRFEREVLASFSINDRNVVRGIDIISTAQVSGYVMEYAGTHTLKERLAQKKIFTIAEAINILTQTCSGLAAIHAARIIHRDIKPANIFINDEKIVKLSGFALARLLDGPSKTKHGEIRGTVGYASPEYLQFGTLDNRSDIYGLGLVAYEMIAGDFPFIGSSPIETLKQRLTSDPVPLSIARRDCPRELSIIVERAMSRDPNKRYQDVSQMAQDLKALVFTESRATTNVTLLNRSNIGSGKILRLQPLAPMAAEQSAISTTSRAANKAAAKEAAAVSTISKLKDKIDTKKAALLIGTLLLLAVTLYGLWQLPRIFSQQNGATKRSAESPALIAEELLSTPQFKPAEVFRKPFQADVVSENSTQPALDKVSSVEIEKTVPVEDVSAKIAPAKPVEIIYNVHPGDTIFKIAQRFAISQEALLNFNEIVDADVLEVGRELKIPPANAKVEASAKLKAQRKNITKKDRSEFSRILAEAQASRAAAEKEQAIAVAPAVAVTQ